MRQAEDSIAASSAGDVLSSIASRLRSRRGEAQVHPEEPYFPLGLAISHLSPMEFNFDLFLYDTLKLPHGLFQDDSNAEKTFETLEECQEYCQRFIQEAERRRTRIQAPEGDRSHEARRSLSKTAMFNNIGTSLTDIMTTGNVAFDAHLADLKLDMFGNVMFIRAPSWSDLAVQFTHGYPRRLITASHAGILPGNLTVAAKISNQAIRSLSVINDDCQLSPNSQPTSSRRDTAVQRQVQCLVGRFITTRTTVESRVVGATTTISKDRRPSGTSGMVRRRKQGTPRRTARLTASAASEGEAGPSHTVPEETLPDEPTAPAPPDPRELLLRVEGIEQRRVPKKDSLQRLAQFLRENRPCPHPLETQQETEEATSAEQGQEQPINIRLRNTVVCAGLSKVWEKSKADCTCLAEPMGSGSQGDVADERCPYCISDMEGSEIYAVSSRCENPDCNPCIMMNQLDKTLLAGLGTKRNERLSAFFQLAPCLAKLFNSGELPEDRRKPLVEAFGDLLSCSLTKVRYLSNIGFLIMLCPRLKQLQLERGWAIVYNNLSKIASAIGYHGNHNSQLAALVFIREFCIPDRENLWRSYLQSEELVEENRILTEVFAGCFEHSQEDNQSS